MLKKIILFLNIILLSFTYSLAHAWTVVRTYESETVGAIAGFSGTTVSDVIAKAGTKSARVQFPIGSDCWSVCGGIAAFPENVYEGGEVWMRGYFYFATPFNFTASPYFKVFRAMIAGGGGAISFLSNSAGNIVINNEPQPMTVNTGVPHTRDGWESLELYVKFSTTAGIVRAWKDGILIFEDKTRRTMSASGQYSNNGYVFTYWNGGVPQTQYAWIDEFVYTNEVPSNLDASGNPMIGLISTSPVLNIPTNLRIVNAN